MDAPAPHDPEEERDDPSDVGPPPGVGPRREPPSYDAAKEDYTGISAGALDNLQGLHDARDFAEMIVDTIREGLLVLGFDLRVQAANESFYRMFGVSPEETIGRLVYDLGSGQWDLPELRELLERILPHDGSFDDYEVEHEFEGLGRRVMVLNARRLNDHQLILLAIEDVTERRQSEAERAEAEVALRESEERFRLLVENAREYAILAMDEESQVTMWSPGAERILGWSREEALGMSGASIFTEEDRAAGVPEQELAQARATGSALDERWHVRKDGSRFWASGMMVALREESSQGGSLQGFTKILRDNTERKEAEDALRESEERYRALFASMDQGYCVVEVIRDGDGRALDYRFLEANPAFEKQTGLVDAVGRTARELVPDLEDHWVEVYDRVAATGEPVRFEQGSEAMGRWFDVFASRLGGPESRRVALLFTDVTEQKAAAEAVRESERRYRALFHQAPAFIAVLRGPEHVFEFVNPAYLRLVGERDLLGRPIREALPELEGQGLFEVLDGVYAKEEPFTAVDRPVLLQREGGGTPERRFVDFVYEPLREADGSISGVIALGADTTERVQAREALDRANRELDRVNRGLEARVVARTRQVRGLARALALAEQAERRRIAHVLHDDLQQDLFGAKVALSLGNTRDAEGILDEAIEVTRSLSHSLSPPFLEGEDLEDLLRWVAERQETRHGLEVEVEAAGDVPVPDPALRVLLYQIVRELLFNVAKHAGTDRARIVAARGDGHIRLVVEDEGSGFDPAALQQDGAVGLGLPSVRERVELVGGRLEIESEPDEGTRVTITVPIEAEGGGR